MKRNRSREETTAVRGLKTPSRIGSWNAVNAERRATGQFEEDGDPRQVLEANRATSSPKVRSGRNGILAYVIRYDGGFERGGRTSVEKRCSSFSCWTSTLSLASATARFSSP